MHVRSSRLCHRGSVILSLLLLAACASPPAIGPQPTAALPAINAVPLLPTMVPSAAPLLSATVLRPSPTRLPRPTPTSTIPAPPTQTPTSTTVFLILLENHNWSSIQGNTAAPYINTTLLPSASYTQQYYNPPGNHPSEPNYLWLEAGTNFGITNDDDPVTNHQSTSSHLVSLLTQAGISWKAYQEDIDGSTCPLTSVGRYAPKHNPMIFFDDVTDSNNPQSATCIAHERPYNEFARDLQNGTVARYNFITPNLCNDMHDCSISTGDTWLAHAVPQILASQVYMRGGVLFITWDEGVGGDGPIGMIVLSPNAKGGGYTNTIPYIHSSTLRTIQEIFGVTPFLGDAANATDLSDLFRVFP
jgi:phosphatidylinositol-3-phosphatase